MKLYIQKANLRGVEKEFARVAKPDREYTAELKETTRSISRRKPLSYEPATIQDARNRGFVRGAKVEFHGDLRVMSSSRIKEIDGNLLAMHNYPFFIYFRGRWCAKVLGNTYEVERLNQMK